MTDEVWEVFITWVNHKTTHWCSIGDVPVIYYGNESYPSGAYRNPEKRLKEYKLKEVIELWEEFKKEKGIETGTGDTHKVINRHPTPRGF